MNINESVLSKMKDRFRSYLNTPENTDTKDGE